MNESPCVHEDAVLSACTTGTWPDPLRDHLESCPGCTDAARVVNALLDAGAAPLDPPLPDPGALWRAAQVRRRRRAIRRATWPIELMTYISCSAAGLAVLAGLVWLWPDIVAELSATVRSLEGPTAPAAFSVPPLALGVGVVAVLWAALSSFDMWAED